MSPPFSLNAHVENNLENELGAHIQLAYFPRILLAFSIACIRKYILRFSTTLTTLKLRNSHCTCEVPDDQIIVRVKMFHAIRPLIPLPRNCLLDSLALLEYLHLSGIAANLIFAIEAEPFRAHCWVEWEGRPLNDRPSAIMTMTPILRI